MTKKELHTFYMEAMRLTQESWRRRLACEKRGLFSRKKPFDNSHLPEKLWNERDRVHIHERLLRFTVPSMLLRDGSGRFAASLTFNQALRLILNPEFMNINYQSNSLVDLANFRLMGGVFRIEIIDDD